MTKSKVYCLPIENLNADNLVSLFDAAGFSSVVDKDKLVAIKVHFGEKGNTAYLKPENVQPISEKVVSLGGKPFLTDSNTLYKGSRANSVDHINTALSHGYCFAPIIIADGLNGKDYDKVTIDGKHFKEVNIGAAVSQCDSMIVMTHFKGHELTGFGGALKNVGMGIGSRSGKQQMHSDVKPVVDRSICTDCGLCIKWCPADAIDMVDSKAKINHDKCIGCAECVVTCNFDAIAINWMGAPDNVQEKIAEYTLGAVKGKKVGYFNFINNVSSNCDCYPFSGPAIVKDVAVLASSDPVAIDQASLDLTNKAAGKDIFQATWPGIDHTVQISYGEKIGLGSRDYELILI